MDEQDEQKMRCLEPGCGGRMERRRPKATVGDPLDEAQELAYAFARAMGPPSFECDRCGKVEGFYQAVGRRTVTVEPLE